MEEKKEVKSWDVTANRYVGYIDIMGFKDMVARMDHDEIFQIMKAIRSQGKTFSSIDWVDGYSTDLVKTTTYSVSIILYTKDHSFEAYDSIVSSISALTNYLFSIGIPHKGALAFGKMTLDDENSIFLGQPLIDAYLLQEEILFYGIVCHGTVDKEIFLNDFKKVTFTAKYLCKLKSGSAIHDVIYPMYTQGDIGEKRCQDLYDSFRVLRYSTSGHLRRYIDNTEEWLSSIKAM